MAAKILRLLCLTCLLFGASVLAETFPAKSLRLRPQRHSATDLEITGLFSTLPHGAHAFLSRNDLLALPQVSAHLTDNENLPHGASVDVRGVSLALLLQRLGISSASDVVTLPCSDGYRANLTREFIAEHHPILVLSIDGMTPAAWAARTHSFNPGPYFIAYDHFRHAFRVLAHEDYAQVPSMITTIDATTSAATFGAITPPLHAAPAAEQGFIIAKQNCLRCHAQGSAGGTKSGFRWSVLAQLAQHDPPFFMLYIHDPRALNLRAQMPPNPSYDQPTLNALRTYFASLPPSNPFQREVRP